MRNHEGHDFVIGTPLLLFLFSLAVRAWICVKQSIIEGDTQFHYYVRLYIAINLLHRMVLQRFLMESAGLGYLPY